MKKRILFLIVILLAAGIGAFAQQAKTDRVTVPLSNPGKPGIVEVSLMMGSIKVVGYEGKEIIVEATPRDKNIKDYEKTTGFVIAVPVAPSPPRPAYIIGDKDKDKVKEQKDKAAGMKRIPIENTGLTIEEDNNTVTIEVESWRRAVDLSIRVPYATSLKLEGTNLGEISVENVNGEIEVENMNGEVKLANVGGTVVANSTNGSISAVLNKVNPDKPLSFATFHGDIDITLPADVKATLKIKSTQGEVFSDFDIALKPVPAKPEETA
ncbi:MAG: DUF4097 family beta strand repeat-containing protein, partial [Candidatus Aminicenantes bacterium]|nr:DUF4097 family beta strand repeat-containing protein [Candidatus Aminicenantes bacterium]